MNNINLISFTKQFNGINEAIRENKKEKIAKINEKWFFDENAS